MNTWEALKGYRTLIWNVLLVTFTAALSQLSGVNWVDVVGPTWAIVIVAAINVGMRLITDTKAGKQDDPAKDLQ